MRSRSAAAACSFLTFLFACDEPASAPVRDADTDAALPSQGPDGAAKPDPVAACDEAVDGTPCGEGEATHCVFGVCLENTCGDGVVAGDEQCDDGNDRDGDGCPASCAYGSLCRDGTLDPGEECDDGNRDDRDACSNSCTIVACGNGRLDGAEECDDGNTLDGDGCSSTCTRVVCGNNRVDPGERCDGLQGCSVDGEACNATCSACELDRCGACMEEKCRDFQGTGIDVYAGCRVEVNEASVPVPVASFIEKCTALDDCIRSHPACVTDVGPVACYCGDVELATCQQGSEGMGPCAAQFPDATGCEEGEGLNNCVLDHFIDLTLPSGWANYLALCRYTDCADVCGHS